MELERTIHTLCDAQVEFVIIGGVSATLHGSARVTYDVDICYSRTKSNLAKLAGALAPFHPRPRGFPAGLPFVWDATSLRNNTVLTLETDLGEIDLLAEVAGIGTYTEVHARSVPVTSCERTFNILDLPALIQAKRAAGREKDLAALPELEALLEARDSTT